MWYLWCSHGWCSQSRCLDRNTLQGSVKIMLILVSWLLAWKFCFVQCRWWVKRSWSSQSELYKFFNYCKKFRKCGERLKAVSDEVYQSIFSGLVGLVVIVSSYQVWVGRLSRPCDLDRSESSRSHQIKICLNGNRGEKLQWSIRVEWLELTSLSKPGESQRSAGHSGYLPRLLVWFDGCRNTTAGKANCCQSGMLSMFCSISIDVDMVSSEFPGTEAELNVWMWMDWATAFRMKTEQDPELFPGLHSLELPVWDTGWASGKHPSWMSNPSGSWIVTSRPDCRNHLPGKQMTEGQGHHVVWMTMTSLEDKCASGVYLEFEPASSWKGWYRALENATNIRRDGREISKSLKTRTLGRFESCLETFHIDQQWSAWPSGCLREWKDLRWKSGIEVDMGMRRWARTKSICNGDRVLT